MRKVKGKWQDHLIRHLVTIQVAKLRYKNLTVKWEPEDFPHETE